MRRWKVKNILFTLSFIAIVCPCTTFAQISTVLIAKFKQDVRTNSFLLDGNIEIYEIKNTLCIVSVAYSNILTTDSGDILKSRTVADIISQEQIAKFVNGINATSNEEIELKKLKMRSYSDNGAIVESIAVTRTIFTTIKEKVSGAVKGLVPVDRWKSLDGKRYYSAYCFCTN